MLREAQPDKPIHQLMKLREKTISNRCQSYTSKLNNIRSTIAVT